MSKPQIKSYRSAFLLFLLPSFLFSCKKNDTTPNGDSLYFPPAGSTEWTTASPQSLGWNTANVQALYDFLALQDTRAFLLLKDGKIVLEKYFGKTITGTAAFNQNSQWYWASAGKTLTSFIVGKAQQEGFLNINRPTSHYLGVGWTATPSAKEAMITVRHHLTMTTGLDDATGDASNTAPAALSYKADAGTRWAYHNAPYTLLQKVVSNATGQPFANYFEAKLKAKTGMDGQWIQSGFDNVYWSTARSMARFGLLTLNKGKWDKEELLSDAAYFTDMVNTSQALNLSYGYLWWLNGKASAMVPQSQVVYPTMLCANAPVDMISAMGKNGQLLSVVPSKGLVIVRMGDNANNTLVPIQFQNNLWEKLKLVINP